MARKPHDAADVLFRLNFADSIHYKFNHAIGSAANLFAVPGISTAAVPSRPLMLQKTAVCDILPCGRRPTSKHQSRIQICKMPSKTQLSRRRFVVGDFVRHPRNIVYAVFGIGQRSRSQGR